MDQIGRPATEQGGRRDFRLPAADNIIDLSEVLQALAHHLIFILAAFVIFAGAAFAGTKLFVRPTYRSGFTAFVNNRKNQAENQAINSEDINASQSLTHTYASIMKSRPVIEDALKESGSGKTYRDVKKGISTEIEDSTQIVHLYVNLLDPKEAYVLARAMEKSAADYVEDIVEGSSMKVVSPPVLPKTPFSPNTKKNALIGGILGMLAAAAVVIAREIMDKRIRSEQELQDAFGNPIVGTIPNYREAGHGGDGGYGYYRKSGNKTKLRRRKT